MRIALIRHGKTIGNLYQTYVGISDQPLCKEGIEELYEKKIRYPLANSVYSSPLTRCTQTAKIIYPNLKPFIIENLKERDFGKFEGLNHKEITSLKGNEQWGLTEESMIFPEGEAKQNFAQRACLGFYQVVQQATYSTSQTIAVVCHGGTIMQIMHHYTNLSQSPYEWQCANGCGYLIVFDRRTKKAKLSRKIN